MPKVLIADKNTQIQRLAMRILKGVGVDVVTVSNGEAAVQKLSEAPPDLVLADIFMPVYNGYEVCQFIKKDERFAHIPVVLLYGKYDPFDQKESQRVRADGALQKPFDPPDPLIGMVKSLLKKAETSRAAAASAPGMRAADDAFKAAVPRHEETQQLSPEEIESLTGKRAYATPGQVAEPEPEETGSFAKPAPELKISEGMAPMGFDEILEAPATETPAAQEPVATPSAEAEELIPDVAEPAEAEPTLEEAEAPNFGGIEMEMKKPTPDEPPIKVEFTTSEPVELVLEDRSSAPAVKIERDPNLASSAGDWAGPPQAGPSVPVEPATPAPEMELTATIEMPEAATEPASFVVPSMEPVPSAPPVSPEAFMPPPVPAPEPAPLFETESAPMPEAVEARVPLAAAPSAMEIPPIAPPVIEEPAAPEPEPVTAPTGLPSRELPGLEWSPQATVETPPVPEPRKAPGVPEAGSAPPQVGGQDLDELVQKVVGQISPEITRRITEEIKRRIAEGGLDLGKK